MHWLDDGHKIGSKVHSRTSKRAEFLILFGSLLPIIPFAVLMQTISTKFI